MQQQLEFDLMASIAGTAGIGLPAIQGFKRVQGRWYLSVMGWGWVDSSELLKQAKGRGL